MQNVKKPGSSNLVIGMMLLTSGRFRHITGKISNTEVWELFKDHTCTSFTIKNKIASELAGFGFWQLNLSTAQNYFSKFQPSWWHFCWMTGVNFNSIHYILVRFLHITQFTVCAAKNLTVIVAGSSRCLEWSSMVAVVSRALRELSEPSLGWAREPRRQTKSLGARRQYSQATAYNVLPAMTGSPAFLTRPPPGSLPGLHSPQKQSQFYKLCNETVTKLLYHRLPTFLRQRTPIFCNIQIHISREIIAKLRHLAPRFAIFRVHARHAQDLIKLGTTSIFCHFWSFVINFSKLKFPQICYKI